MKFVFVIAFLALATICLASPVENQPENSENFELFEDTHVLSRSKRATCPWFPGACSVHCKTKGFSTGFCRGGTCTCKNH
ncbi:defensin-A-like [Arctopsyche grandis]|uniref:defensin-A-like n=1 Tax=Arctopsyche grandis TaxID=121162 RepID=UPI00406DA435